MKTYALGDILELQREWIEVDPTKNYVNVGVRSFGRGLFHYEPTPGAELSRMRFHELRPGALVVSNIKAWEGAVGVASDREAGCIATNRMLTYMPKRPDLVDIRYLWYFLSSRDGTALLDIASPGSADRNRTLSIDRFEALEVVLPQIDEQRQIGERLDTIFGKVKALEQRAAKVDASSAAALFPSLAERIFLRRTSALAPVREFATIISDVVHPGDDPLPAQSFIGLQHIESHTGRRLGEMPLGGEKGRKFRFRPGDVLYGYLRPYLNKVWLADRHGLCSVDQYVLRPKPGSSAGLLAHSLRSQAFLRRAIDLTHSLQLPRLRSGLLLDVEIPVVDARTSESVESELDLARNRILNLVHLRRIQASKLEALNPSILNRAFNSGF